MVASLPASTITGSSAADVRTSTPGTPSLIDVVGSGDTITLSNDTDWAYAGNGADSITVGGTGSVSLTNNVIAGFGSDTISLNAASTSIAAVGFSVNGNQGNDSISISAGGSLNSAFVGGGDGTDTIVLSNISTFINSEIKGGDKADTLTVGTGTLSNSIISGNKGADTINFQGTASTNGSIAGGLGKDTIQLVAAVANWVNGGAGTDSILAETGSVVTTLAGGGLADTITFSTTFGGGTIYGDGVGVTTSGSGQNGTADGADRIFVTGGGITAGASIYGAGGADTISLADVTGTAANVLLVNGGDQGDSILMSDNNSLFTSSLIGGDGADTITVTTAQGGIRLEGNAGQDSLQADAGSALSIFGGEGLDTINFIAVTATSIVGGSQADLITVATASNFTASEALVGAATIDGGNGADTIQLQGMVSAQSIAGGAGNDYIRLGVAANKTGLAFNNASGSIIGGAGTDTIALSASAGGGIEVSTAMTGGIANIAYEAGDVIHLVSTAAAGGALNGLIAVGNSAGDGGKGAVTGITAMSAGTLAVFSTGTDTIFAFKTNDAASAIVFRVTGADLVTTTAINQNLAATTANFGFTLTGSSAAGGITINLV